MKRILVALSGTPYTPVSVRYALDLARRHEAEVTAVTIADLARLANVGPVPVGAGAAAHDLAAHRIEEAQQRMDEVIAEFEAACRDTGIRHRVVREAGDPFEELIDLWRYHDLTIVGFKGLFEYGLIHHPQDYITTLVHKGVRPVLAVSAEYHDTQRVMIAYNGSHESAKAMKYFVQMNLWQPVQARIVCWGDEDEIEQPEILLRDARSYCEAYGLEVETEHRTGRARYELLSCAEDWKADLIVMGATNRRRILKYVLGDTVVHSIQHAHVPLFLAQ